MTTRLQKAVVLRDLALPRLEAQGEPYPEPPMLDAQRKPVVMHGTSLIVPPFRLLLRAPQEAPPPREPAYWQQHLNLPWALEVWREGQNKVMHLIWAAPASVVRLVSFRPGDWPDLLLDLLLDLRS